MTMPNETEPNKTIWYFKLSFTGKVSNFTENKLQKLTKWFYKVGTNIKIVVSTFELHLSFQLKIRSHMA